MRAFVFLLILGNLLFLAWAQGYFGASSNSDAFRMEQQLLADQVRIVARDEFPAGAVKSEPAAKAPEKKVATVCLNLVDLAAADAGRVESALADKFSAYRTLRTNVPGSASYWVFIPPLGSKQEVDNKVAELKKLRVPELYVVQENGPNNRAISLGLFSTKEAANVRLELLRGKGVKSAKIGERHAKPASIGLEMQGPESESEAVRQLLAELLPENKLTACKASVAGQ